MCVMSMVIDHRTDEWNRRYYPTWPPQVLPQIPPPLPPPAPTAEELAEFRRLLKRAREYDRRNNEPDCEMDDKKRVLKDMASELGVDISFVDAP